MTIATLLVLIEVWVANSHYIVFTVVKNLVRSIVMMVSLSVLHVQFSISSTEVRQYCHLWMKFHINYSWKLIIQSYFALSLTPFWGEWPCSETSQKPAVQVWLWHPKLFMEQTVEYYLNLWHKLETNILTQNQWLDYPPCTSQLCADPLVWPINWTLLSIQVVLKYKRWIWSEEFAIMTCGRVIAWVWC